MSGTTRAFKPILISVVLLGLGLAHTDQVHCSKIDSKHPIPLSNYFEARGFPYPWVATDNGTCGDIPGVPGRILWSELLRSFVFWAVVTTIGGFLLSRRARVRGTVFVVCTATLLGPASARGQNRRPTLRDMMLENRAADLGQFPQDLLDAPIDDEKRSGRYVHLSFHVNPSAERLLVLSRDMKLQRELYGWELATLPDERIVYHHSQIHFAPTHWLEISVFDPTTLKEKQIYPPKPYQPVRRDFIERVARVYRERGEVWFREHNHHMDPELFDSALVGAVSVDAAGRFVSFTVRFGGSDNANDPLPFSQLVRVSCDLIDQIEQVECRERADVSPGR